jgi:SAM-dependent methyltransferase
MSVPARMTDRSTLMRHRARAQATGPALFLHETVRDEAEHRLSLVNRSFTNPAIVTPFPQVWHGFGTNPKFVSDDPVLDLDEAAHDLVLHALALHWADDPVGQLIQCRRALRPDGLLLAICFGGQTLNELRASLGEAEIALTGGLSPRIAPMAEIRDLGALLQRAGLALPVADAWTQRVEYADPFALMRDLRAMGESNALAARLRRPTRRAVLLRAAERYAETFATAEGRIPASFEFIALTGWAPDAGQPQPLRPGSAKTRLADALGTQERPLND